MTKKPLFTDADVIFAYTRADALADGVLRDVSDLALEAGITFPTAMTAAAWAAAIEPPADCPEQSITGRLWDVLNVLRVAAVRAGRASRIDFTVRVRHDASRPGDVRLKALAHAGDHGEAVITIMLPHED